MAPGRASCVAMIPTVAVPELSTLYTESRPRNATIPDAGRSCSTLDDPDALLLHPGRDGHDRALGLTPTPVGAPSLGDVGPAARPTRPGTGAGASPRGAPG